MYCLCGSQKSEMGLSRDRITMVTGAASFLPEALGENPLPCHLQVRTHPHSLDQGPFPHFQSQQLRQSPPHITLPSSHLP